MMEYDLNSDEMNKMDFYYRLEMRYELDNITNDKEIDWSKGRDELYAVLENLAYGSRLNRQSEDRIGTTN